MKPTNVKIGIIGLGYVGLPLAIEFENNGYEVIGFDISKERVENLLAGIDSTGEVSREKLERAAQLKLSTNVSDLATAEVLIITVPTPIDHAKSPDLNPLAGACKAVGQVLSKGTTVIFESTVYPGCTEEFCVPILEATSGLKFNEDFFCGYSPERINPGDPNRGVTDIVKVTSGSTPETATFVDNLYASIIKAGTHKASSIKVAEAAKVIENAQRDINIAFVNELAVIFNKLEVDTHEVLAAAGTKWNFLPFTPGLVGGHCIGVDPYYLTYKAESEGYHPEVILAGRRINDNMGAYVAQRIVKMMIQEDIPIKDTTVTILGITFKENCPDIRNSKVIDVINELNGFGIKTAVVDPLADKNEVFHHYGITLVDEMPTQTKAVVLAVAHEAFSKLDFAGYCKAGKAIFDVKNFVPNAFVSSRL